MTARILVVDDIVTNIKLLEVRLLAEYFDVLQATNGPQAIAICEESLCDMVLLDAMMPGMDGFEVCRHLKSSPSTAHIPIIMVTALDQPSDRVRGLDAGADDFLTKPVDEVALIARVRSLSRLKLSVDELRTRAMTSAILGVQNTFVQAIQNDGLNGRILLVDDRPASADRIVSALSKHHTINVEPVPQEAIFRCAEGNYDMVIVSLGLRDYDGLRLCSQLRTLERTRHIPILLIADMDDRQKVLRGLDLGVNDYLSRPIDRNELMARVRTQMRRKRYAEALREDVQASIEMAVVDPLTGLKNRRYLETHLASLLEQAVSHNRPLAILILDIDHFKMVNDSFGHEAGDDVLRGFSQRVKRVIRTSDLMCRLGGEEFVVIMPDTTPDVAAVIAERVRGSVQAEPFRLQDSDSAGVPITVSIGLAFTSKDSSPDTLFRRADKALYRSKNDGRNRVTADAA